MRALSWAALAVLVCAAPAPAEERPAPRLDRYGDPLPEGAVARLGTVRLRGRCAWCLAFSGDGKTLAAGNSDFTARLWDAASGREVRRFRGNGLGQVHHIALSPDGTTLATFDLDQGVMFWGARTGKHLRKAEYRPRLPLGLDVPFTFSADGRALYVGGLPEGRAIGVADGKTVAVLASPEKGRALVAVAPGGKAAVSEAWARLVAWDLRTGKALGQVAAPRERGLVALSPDGRRLAVATKESRPAIVVWDLSSGMELCRCKGHLSEVTSLAFSPEGKSLASGAHDLTARLWDAESGKERWSYRSFGANFYWVTVVFGPDGKTVGVTGWEGIPRLLDAETGKDRVPVPGHVAELVALAVAPDGRSAYTASNDQSLRHWELKSGKALRALKEPSRDFYDPKEKKVVHSNEWIYGLSLSPDGKTLAVASLQGIRLWDVSDPARPRERGLFPDHSEGVLSPDGRLLAASGRTLRLLDARTGKVLREGAFGRGRSLRFSSDGRALAVGSDQEQVFLFDVPSLEQRAVLRGGGVQQVSQLAFSPDGQLLASSGMDWRVNLWEVASGQLRRRISRPTSMMDAIAFSPDGRTLAFAGLDQGIFFHELSSGRVVRSLAGHEGQVGHLTFTPDGRRLISTCEDTTALVWNVPPLPAPGAPAAKLNEKDLQNLWDQLGGEAGKADLAMRELAARPTQAVELLRPLLRPADKEVAARIARLVRELDSDSFVERERAREALEDLGEAAAGALRAALAAKPSLELTRRAEALLARLKGKGASPSHLRVLRGVQVLEWVGTVEARGVLERLASGAPAAERTRAAEAALACLKRR